MHGKESVIAPVLKEGLGLVVEVAAGVDTDRFGTFTREIARPGSQLDAARAKVAAAFAAAPWARFGLASEGSFGPHPELPVMAIGRELVLLVDREARLEVAGYDVGIETNFAHAIVRNAAEARAFAMRAAFPGHGLIVMGWRDQTPDPAAWLDKNVGDVRGLEEAVQRAVAVCGEALVETDMRANRNPTRMRAIGRATRDLVERYLSRCPRCARPGFAVTERLRGLPCAWCGAPTRMIAREISTCASCGFRREGAVGEPTADPGCCEICNP